MGVGGARGVAPRGGAVKPAVRLGLALLCGAAAAAATWTSIRAAHARAARADRVVPVLVARRYLPIGAAVEEKHVAERAVPEAHVQPGALRSLKDLKGEMWRARVGVLPGEQVTRSKLLSGALNPGLAWSLEPPFGAASLRLAAEEAAGGWIRPGDWVAVLAAWDRLPDGGAPYAEVLFPRVRVWAVNETRWDPEAGLNEGNSLKQIEKEGYLVTLGLTAADAVRLELARARGRVSLALLPGAPGTGFRAPRLGLAKNGPRTKP